SHTIDKHGNCTCYRKGCVSPGEHPANFRGLAEATTNERQLRLLWSEFPNANVGVRTGVESQIAVLRIKIREGGEESLKELIESHAELPFTYQTQVIDEVREIYFRHPGVAVWTGNLAPGLWLLGENSFVLLPPSIHPSGNKYEWIDEYQLEPMPSWLMEEA